MCRSFRLILLVQAGLALAFKMLELLSVSICVNLSTFFFVLWGTRRSYMIVFTRCQISNLDQLGSFEDIRKY